MKSFWASLVGGPAPGPRKFTLEELRELYAVLIKNPVVTESNKALVVETIRTVAEFMIWGDQNEPRIFDYLLENNIMTYLHRILLQPSNRAGDVAKQVLQTLSIIIQNVRSETAVFFLFSNNHVNNIVDLDFDFSDEEVLGFYVSFLKTISLKLNPTTVNFFLVDAGGRPSFPLYTRATRLAHNREGMVRAAVRTITLNVFSVDDAGIRAFVASAPHSQYFGEIGAYLAEQVQVRRGVRGVGGVGVGGGQGQGWQEGRAGGAGGLRWDGWGGVGWGGVGWGGVGGGGPGGGRGRRQGCSRARVPARCLRSLTAAPSPPPRPRPQLLDRRMVTAEGGGVQALGALDSQMAELEDIISYCGDTLSIGGATGGWQGGRLGRGEGGSGQQGAGGHSSGGARPPACSMGRAKAQGALTVLPPRRPPSCAPGVPAIAELLARSLWDAAISPLLLRPLLAPGAAAAAAAPLPAPGASAVPLSARAAAAAAAAAGSALAGSGGGGGAAAAAGAAAGRPPGRVRPVASLFVLERLFQQLAYEPLLHQMLLALAAGDPASGTGAGGGGCSCRRALIEVLGGGQPYPAVLVLRLLVAVLANRYVSADLLDALRLLPRRRVMGGGGGFGGAPASSGGGADVGDPRLLLDVCLEQLRAAARDGVADPWAAAAAARSGGGGGGGGGGSSSSSGSGSASGGSGVPPLVSLLTHLYLPSQLREVSRGRGSRPGTASSSGGAPQAADGVDAAGAALERMSLADTWRHCCAASGGGGKGGGKATPAAAAAAAGLVPFGDELIESLVALLSQPTLPSLGLWLTGWLLFQLLPVDADAAAAAAPLQHAATPPASSRASEASAAFDSEGEEEDDAPGASTGDSGAPASVSGTSGGGDSAAAAATAAALARPVPPVPSYSGLAPCPAAASREQLEAVDAALEAAQLELREHVLGIWCEALGPMVALEWPTAREGLQRPVLRASSEALLSGPHACAPAAAVHAAAGGGGGGGGSGSGAGRGEGLSQSAQAALAAYLAAQRVVGLLQLKEVRRGVLGRGPCAWAGLCRRCHRRLGPSPCSLAAPQQRRHPRRPYHPPPPPLPPSLRAPQLLLTGAVAKAPPIATLTDAELRAADVQEGFSVDLHPAASIPAIVSFTPGVERRVFFSIAGVAAARRGAAGAAGESVDHALLRSLPVTVVADPSPTKPNSGVVLSVAPLLGADPRVDGNVGKWLHVHVRPSVRGLLRVFKVRRGLRRARHACAAQGLRAAGGRANPEARAAAHAPEPPRRPFPRPSPRRPRRAACCTRCGSSRTATGCSRLATPTARPRRSCSCTSTRRRCAPRTAATSRRSRASRRAAAAAAAGSETRRRRQRQRRLGRGRARPGGADSLGIRLPQPHSLTRAAYLLKSVSTGPPRLPPCRVNTCRVPAPGARRHRAAAGRRAVGADGAQLPAPTLWQA
jgi:hypothetical protein